MQFKAGALELVRKDGFKLFGLKRRFREDPEVRVAGWLQTLLSLLAELSFKPFLGGSAATHGQEGIGNI